MEGSVATTGATGADGAAQQGAEGGADAGPSLSELAGQMSGFQEGQEALRGLVQDLAQQLQPQGGGEGGEGEGEGEGGDEPLDLGFLDDPTMDAADVAQHLQGLIDSRAQQIANQAINPLAERIDGMDRKDALKDLVADIPDMGNKEIANQVIQATADMADAYGWPDELKQDPRMYRVVYLAAKAAEIAAEEGNGEVATAHLEGGGGARAAGAQPEKDWGKEIVDARKGKAALPFG